MLTDHELRRCCTIEKEKKDNKRQKEVEKKENLKTREQKQREEKETKRKRTGAKRKKEKISLIKNCGIQTSNYRNK